MTKTQCFLGDCFHGLGIIHQTAQNTGTSLGGLIEQDRLRLGSSRQGFGGQFEFFQLIFPLGRLLECRLKRNDCVR